MEYEFRMISRVLEIISFYEYGEGADYHDDKHIFTSILQQYAIDYDMATLKCV